MEEISNFISTVGFPVVVAVAMFYQNNTLSTNYQKLTQQLQDKIESNTEVLTRVVERLENDVNITGKSDTNVPTNR